MTSISFQSPNDLKVGETVTLTATGLVNGQTVTFTDGLWGSSNSDVATVDHEAGVVTGVAAGTTDVSVSLCALTYQRTVNVVDAAPTDTDATPTITAMAVTGASTLEAGLSTQFTATATRSDDSTQDVTTSATWSSSNTVVATVTSGGSVTGHQAGVVNIRAEVDGMSDDATLTVTVAPVAATVTGLEVRVASAVLNIGDETTVSATAIYSDGTSQVVDASWLSEEEQVATVTAAGVVTAVSAGTANIKAAFEGVSQWVTVTVTGPTVTGLEVRVASAVLNIGAETTVSATAIYSDGTSQVVDASWLSEEEQVATVTPAGVVTAVSAGTANIKAAFEGVSQWVTVTVTGPAPTPTVTLTGLSVSASGFPTLHIGVETTARATASYSDNTTALVTAAWSSSNNAVATVSTTGVVTAVSAGTVEITGTYEGQSDSVTVTVPVPTLEGIIITGATEIAHFDGGDVDQTAQLTATGTYSDGSTKVLTNSADGLVWSSSNTAMCTVNADGVITGVEEGSVTITATVGWTTDDHVVSVL